ncbi:hypothetical protein P7K49_025012, partial [Saguinus oedipus]
LEKPWDIVIRDDNKVILGEKLGRVLKGSEDGAQMLNRDLNSNQGCKCGGNNHPQNVMLPGT